MVGKVATTMRELNDLEGPVTYRAFQDKMLLLQRFEQGVKENTRSGWSDEVLVRLQLITFPKIGEL